MRSYFFYCFAWLAMSVFVPVQAKEPIKDVSAILTYAGSKLVVEYTVPPTCSRLNFVNNGIKKQVAATIRNAWVPLNDCGRVDAEGIDVKSSCSSVRFEVPTSTANFDRVYPWAYPLDAGIYAHTSAYSVTETCGATNWTFSAPDGAVVVDGVPSSGSMSRSQQSTAYHPVVFFSRDISASNEYLYVDSRFSPQAREFLESTTKKINDTYREILPGLDFMRPFVLAVPSEGGKRWRGDVANGNTMRLSFSANPSTEELKDLQLFFAHEAAHLLQPSTSHEAWQAEIDSIREGGAELLSIYAAVRLGWISTDEFIQRAENAINNCLLSAENRPWQKILGRKWGRSPYDCGLMFHIIALNGSAKDKSPWMSLRDYYLGGKQGKPTDFASALECAGKSDCSPRWLRMAFGNAQPLQDVFSEFGRSSGLFRERSSFSARQIETLARKILGNLMAGDCRGQISLYHEVGLARVGSVTSCGVLREGMTIVGVENLPLFSDQTSHRHILEQCRTAGTVKLNLKDGQTVSVNCRDSLSALPVLYRIERDRFIRRFLPPAVR